MAKYKANHSIRGKVNVRESLVDSEKFCKQHHGTVRV